MTTPLEHFGLIGDGETAALVSRHGSIDWLCLPRFDSPSCCAALIGSSDNGYWSITPSARITSAEQRYEEDTLILETEMTTADGKIRITDFMPIRERDPVLVRIVAGLSGAVEIVITAALRFDYGKMPPWITKSEERIVMHVGPDKVILEGAGDAEIKDSTVTLRFPVEEGGRHIFTLSYASAHDPAPEGVGPDDALTATREYWRDWIAGCDDLAISHREHFRRSLLTLKALIHRPTGGLVAAATTSLPEQAGGQMNWDYRYCWLRDATFTLSALIKSGYLDEAAEWRDWILRAVAGAPDKLQVLYRVDGSRRLDEAELPWLSGYRFAMPVRIGNAAADQHQLDIYGELINMLHISEKAGMERTEQGRHLEHAVIGHVEKIWSEPDQGLWESRGMPRHYTHSKVMAWVALDRFLAGAGGEEIEAERRERLARLREHIHGVICREGFNEGLGSFTSYFGGHEVDPSLLLLPKLGFLSADDERIAGTIARIEKELVVDGLVWRARADSAVEGAFVACSFWLADCQLLQGRRDDAAATIARALSTCGDLGLLSEEFDLASNRLTGNYPQALSHLALVNALIALSAFDHDQKHKEIEVTVAE